MTFQFLQSLVFSLNLSVFKHRREFRFKVISLVTEKLKQVNPITVILSLVYALGGNEPFSGLQDVTVNSSPKAGVTVPLKGISRTLRAHLPARCDLTAPPLWSIFLNTTICALTTELWLQTRLRGVVARICFAQSLRLPSVGSE